MRKNGILVFLSMAIAFFAQANGEETELETALQPSGTIPVVYINTENNDPILSKTDYLNATMWIDSCGVEDVEAFGSADEPMELQIRGRGNSSWSGFAKKPYRLKLAKKGTPLGFPKSKHFVLLAHAPTQSQMRNVTTLQLARQIGLGWQPQNMPVELVINGEYLGVYSFCQNIRIDSDRVNISEQPDSNLDLMTIDDGWLVEIDNNPDTPQILVPQNYDLEGGPGVRFARFTCKTPEVLSPFQEAWITAQMGKITRMIYSEDKSECEWEELVDIESLAKYYIIQELTCNYDAFRGSTFIYHTAGGKWTFGPLWDCEWTYVSGSRSGTFWDERAWQTGSSGRPVWISEIWKFRRFREEVLRQWEAFYPEKYDAIYDFVDDFYSRYKDAFVRNGERWPQYNGITIHLTYSWLKSQLKNYGEWMDEFCRKASGISPVSDDLSGIRVFAEGDIIRVESEKEVAGVSVYDLSGMVCRAEPVANGVWQAEAGRGLRIVCVTLVGGESAAMKIMVR